MEWTAELLLSLRETTSYPALLARLDRASSGEVSFDSRDLLEDFLEPEMKEASDEARFSLLLEEGEIGAARKLHSLLQFGSKERARIVRHASSFKQELEASLRRIMGLLLLLKDTEGERLQGLREQAEHLSNNQSLQESRPGCVLKLLEPVERELESICRRTLDDLRVVADSLQHDPTLTQNRDVTLALKRLHQLLDSQESLPDAQQMLLLLQRAISGDLNPEDLRQLHQNQLEREDRLIRPWSEFQEMGVQTADEILQLLQRDDCPVFFKSANYRQNALELFRYFLLQGKRLRVERASAKLFDFLHLPVSDKPAATTKHGIRYNLTFVEPRVPAFRSGRLRTQLQLVFPVQADPGTLQRLLQSIPSDVFPVVYYPGCLDSSLKELFRLREDVAHFDNLDLLRLVECRLDQREHAFQQILLPRCPMPRVDPWQLSGPVALEMFRGRHGVIERLKAPRGGTVLFSGRMMGKSSILDKLASELHAIGRQCIKLSNVGGSLIKPLVERVAALLPDKEGTRLLSDDKALQPVPSLTPTRKSQRRQERLARLRQAVHDLFRHNEALHLTILVDEADHFAAEDAGTPRNESLAWLLRDLEFNHVEQLRVVFAGFQTIHHQVISGNSAFANWFGLVQLTTLERQDASRLVREPFADFGFLFASNAGINRILEYTGQHPLLIQETCSRLMHRMAARRQRGQEDEVLQVHAGDVESICRDDQLRDRVHQVLSLNLNQFPRLKLMVYLILYSTTYGDSQAQFTLKSFRLDDLKALLLEWYQEQLNEYFDEKSIGALVQELMTLGLLARRGETYEFVNTTFASMLLEDSRFDSELEHLLALVMNPDSTEARRFPTLLSEDLERLRHAREQHILFTGLPGSMRTSIARALFEDDQEALLLSVEDCECVNDVETCLKSRVEERRKTLSFSDLLLKNHIRTLVLDGLQQLEDADTLLEIAEELSTRNQRLIVFGGASLARSFSATLCAGNFELMSLRRLREKDIKAWGVRLVETDEVQIVLDEKSCEELVRVTGGFLSLVTPFKNFCKSRLQNAREYFPNRDLVTAYARQWTASSLEKTLLSTLLSTERTLLQSLFEKAEEEDIWQFDYKFLEEFLLGRALNSDELDALDILQNLHLVETVVTEGRRLLQLRPKGPLRRIFTKKDTTT